MDTCVICGEYIPEGTMVCINCQKEIMEKENNNEFTMECIQKKYEYKQNRNI